MNWKDYESEIFKIFKDSYPKARISFNKRLMGRYSKTHRQIDVLIEGYIAGKKIKIVIDGKLYASNIDVKDVEEFISMVEDVEADQGILITSKGYSEAALNRAYYGPSNIELDILSFEELKKFQGFGGIAYSLRHGVVIPAPFGWIVDITKRKGSIANLYQRGKTYEESTQKGEWIYFSIYSYDEVVKNLEDLIKLQEETTLHFNPQAKFEYENSINREDNRETRLRKILRTETSLHEYTGFVDFEGFCAFCVLFTPENLSTKNIRKLEYILERLIPLNVDLESLVKTEIHARELSLQECKSDEEKADILISMAGVYRDADDLDKAQEKYLESLKFKQDNYGASLGLLQLNVQSDNRNDLIDNFFELDPGNTKIMYDLTGLSLQYNFADYLNDFFLKKIKKYKHNNEIVGNIYFSLAHMHYHLKNNKRALKLLKISEKFLSKCLKDGHEAFSQISSFKSKLKQKVNDD